MKTQLIHGDCLERLKELPDCSVDAVVTDPPYGLSFMGKKWDYDVPREDVWRECLRVLKPGGHLLSFAGTRTQHRMAVNIEDAGFEIRDMISYLYSTNETMRQLVATMTPEQLKLMDATFGRDSMIGWAYGSGFPKSLDVSKAIDKAAGAEREVVRIRTDGNKGGGANTYDDDSYVWDKPFAETAPATDAAKKWAGFGSALKPSLEPVTVARKPFKGTLAENVLAHGTGAINVDACRVGTESRTFISKGIRPGSHNIVGDDWDGGQGEKCVQGRWPANLIHDGSDEVVGLFPVTTSKSGGTTSRTGNGLEFGMGTAPRTGHDDSGSAARFFYQAKCSKKDRNEGCEHLPEHQEGLQLPRGKCPDCGTWKNAGEERCKCGGEWELTSNPPPKSNNNHPTVKPTDLMRYLCRLVTPPGGTVLDPFMGSGSTGKAAILEGFNFIGIEREAEYLDIAKARIEAAKTKKQEELI